MRLYHGSNYRIIHVDLSFSHDYKDFGTGFYLTPDYGRAVKMANRITTLANEGSPEITPFIFVRSRCPNELQIKEFKKNDSEWAKFVMQNRDRNCVPPYKHDYDIVIGPVADSRVDPIIKNYRECYGESYLKNENLEKLAAKLIYPGERYIQYCFCTERALEFLLYD